MSKNKNNLKSKLGKERGKRKIMQDDTNVSNDSATVTVMPESKNWPFSKGVKKFDRGWKNNTAVAFVLIFAGWGVYMLVNSFAATPTATKTWSTASDWNGGTLSSAVVTGNSVMLEPTATSAATSSAASATSPVVKNNASGSIKDGNGNVWTVRQGVIAKNGSRWAASYSANVVQIAYVNNIVWQENSSNLWWYWNGRGWTGGNGISTSPLAATNPTVVQNNSSASITDSSNSKWTVKNGVIERNGNIRAASYSANVVQIAYVNNIVWQENSSNLWWYWNGRGWSGGDGIPMSPLTSSTSTGGGSTSTSYVPSGSIVLTFDATASVTWNSLTNNATTPSGTSVATQVRTSSDGSTWSAWTSNVSQAAASRYIQIQASLATTDPASTPTLSGLTLTYTPPAGAKPTVSIAAASSTVASGQATTITWSSTNATACTASGAWSGSVGTSGSKSTGNLSATGTYSLSCTGANGSATGSVIVTVTPATSSGGGSTGSSSGFITASGTSLMQNGKVYKSVSFNFSPVGSCWSSNWTTAQMDQFFAAIPPNSIARFFAPPGGTDSAAFVQSIVKEADKYNVHLLISLAVADVYGQCDAGDSDSTSTGKTAAYYTDAVKSGSAYANWVKSVVTPLANDPGVAMWEIINEPWHNSNSPLSSVGGASGAATYTNAAAALIRAAETAGAGSPKQLITLGPADIGETGGVSGMEQIFKNIDVVDDHDYSGDLGGATAYDSNELSELVQIGKALNKPYMIDEAGVEAGANCNASNLQNAWDSGGGLTLQNRVSFLLTHKATDYFNAGLSYVGYWLYTTPGQESSGCTYENINPSDPLMPAVKSYSIP